MEVSINLLKPSVKVVSVKEEHHSIELQFEITLKWKESRDTNQNLKGKRYLNEEDLERLWFPLVVYASTDQQERTSLGMDWEWSTSVSVLREGNFARSDLTVFDEIEVFKGEENNLVKEQAYTHELPAYYFI